jgi:hypothetical protein
LLIAVPVISTTPSNLRLKPGLIINISTRSKCTRRSQGQLSIL